MDNYYKNRIYNNSYIVEVKSHLREDSITQTLNILKRFSYYFPVHKDKKVYGILAAVDVKEDLKRKVFDEGLYLAFIHVDLFEINEPDGFHPKSFQSNM